MSTITILIKFPACRGCACAASTHRLALREDAVTDAKSASSCVCSSRLQASSSGGGLFVDRCTTHIGSHRHFVSSRRLSQSIYACTDAKSSAFTSSNGIV